MTAALALAVLVAAGVFLVVLGAAAVLAPSRARGYLLGFAGSAGKHYVELALRFVLGGAFVLVAPRSVSPVAFNAMGWVLLATTTALALVPWRWHRRFAQQVVPVALRVLPLLGVSSLALGVGLLWALLGARTS